MTLQAIAEREGFPEIVKRELAYGETVALMRQYASARPRNVLTDRQVDLLNMPGIPGGAAPVFADYIDLGLRMLIDRLKVESIDGAGDWTAEVLGRNRFDALQLDIFSAAVRDGDAYIICAWDGYPKFHLNTAFDGTSGIIPVREDLVLKMSPGYYELYEPHRYRKALIHTGDETSFEDAVDIAYPLGILPVAQFSYRRGIDRGESAILRAIPLQDALNHSFAAMIVAAKFAAFRVFFAKNWEPENQRLDPGDFLWAFDQIDKQVSLEAIPSEGLAPYLEQNQQIIQMLGEVLQLPLPTVLGSNPSAEALKQKEVGLLSEVKQAQIRFGNVFEDLMSIAHAADTLWSSVSPPPVDRFNTIWVSPEVRDDNAIVQRLAQIFDRFPNKRLFLEELRGVLNLTDEDINRLLAEDEADAQRRLSAFGDLGALGDFTGNERGIGD